MSNIQFTNTPSPEDIDKITQNINEETPEYGMAHPFGFFIRDDASNVIAGANGFVIYGSVYTDQLWVDKQYRKKGLARELMDRVHAFGEAEGCSFASVQTMNFQGAQTFYEKLGYIQDFQRAGFVNDSYCIYMKKSLNEES